MLSNYSEYFPDEFPMNFRIVCLAAHWGNYYIEDGFLWGEPYKGCDTRFYKSTSINRDKCRELYYEHIPRKDRKDEFTIPVLVDIIKAAENPTEQNIILLCEKYGMPLEMEPADIEACSVSRLSLERLRFHLQNIFFLFLGYLKLYWSAEDTNLMISQNEIQYRISTIMNFIEIDELRFTWEEGSFTKESVCDLISAAYLMFSYIFSLGKQFVGDKRIARCKYCGCEFVKKHGLEKYCIQHRKQAYIQDVYRKNNNKIGGANHAQESNP